MIRSHLSVGNWSTGATNWVPALLTRYVDRAERLGGAPDEALDRLGPGQVGIVVEGAHAPRLDLGAHGLDLRRIAEAVQHDTGAFSRERARDGETDAGRGAGDERGLPLEKHELPFNSDRRPFVPETPICNRCVRRTLERLKE